MNDLLFISLENWDEVWRRNQFVCAALARRHPEMKILFVGLPLDFSNTLRRRALSELRGEHTRALAELPNITVTRPWKLVPNSLTPGLRFNELLFRRHVRRMVRQVGLRKPILWLNPHSAVHMVGRMGESACIYDITDDWISMDQPTALAARIARQDEELCRRADAVIVCSKRLFDLKRPLSDVLHLIPNGVDADHYKAVVDGDASLPQDAARWSKPVLGYTGSIHEDRVDLHLVKSLAERFPAGTIALVGPVMLPPELRQSLASHKNVVLTGPIPYAALPQYMRAFDVCITPHRMTPFTESLNPIKLWEYLAAGKPIVATDVAGFRDYPSLVHLAKTPAAFAAAVQSALCEDPGLKALRQAEAAKNSWDSRIDAMEAVLDSATRHRATPDRLLAQATA